MQEFDIEISGIAKGIGGRVFTYASEIEKNGE